MSSKFLDVSIQQLLRRKRDGEMLTKDEIYFFVKCISTGEIAESQLGAFLMAVYLKGLSDEETVHLTQSMVQSGDQLQWSSDWKCILVDKHSTGGVGDKISLILAPVLAACGLKVPMISGRSLEHTGGTLDKLESIPGFTVNLDQETMRRALECAGCFIVASTTQLCPADRIMYSVRDITCTVDSASLMVSSIISKKVVSGARFLVVDVKVGKAAFCKSVQSARILARKMIDISANLGIQTRVVLSRMDDPLGNTVGNALEVVETVQCLAGNIPPDIAALVFVLGWVWGVDASKVGEVCLRLGAGRQCGTQVDHSVGVIVSKHTGDKVQQGETWLTVHHSCKNLPLDTVQCLEQAINIGTTEITRPDIIIEVIK